MIKKVSKQDKIIWAKLCCKLWPDNSIEDILNEISNNEHCYLYYFEDTAIGFINLSLRTDYVEGTNTSPVAYVEGIYVKEEFRNKGIAKSLIDFAKKWAIQNGCKQLASDCELSNKDSRSFHNKIGFSEANTIVCFTMDLTN